MNRPTCETCIFWDNTQKGHTTSDGLCRRRAPRFLVSDNGDTDDWATTGDRDWCGEHQNWPRYQAWWTSQRSAQLAEVAHA